MDKNDEVSHAENGYGDDQGTRVGAPDQQWKPTQHTDTPPDRPERQTGAGSETTAGTAKPPEAHEHEHRGGYGGSGGRPVSSSGEGQRP
jgi:hypothetical protein